METHNKQTNKVYKASIVQKVRLYIPSYRKACSVTITKSFCTELTLDIL